MNTFPIGGTVYAMLLNHRDTLDALGDAVQAKPYLAPPSAPILHVRPAPTWSASGAVLRLPADMDAADVEATIGIVFDRATSHVAVEDATDHVRGLVVVADVTAPHASVYRPAIRQRNRAGFCVFGTPCFDVELASLAAARVETWVDGALAATNDTGGLIRDAAHAIADISAFMRFDAGDVLLLGAVGLPVRVERGHTVRVQVEGLDAVTFDIDRDAEVDATMPRAAPTRRHGPVRRGRIAWEGAIHDVTEADGLVRLADGRLLDERVPVWLPPFAPVARARSIFALGLNYADHAKELAFKAPDEPLIFMKGESAFVGHRGVTRRPRDVAYMHYECELVVVIGRTARAVKRDDAYDFVAGYTVANDYAIRDYLENYYRPNLKVKNREGATPIGPWLVDARAVPDPMDLALTTRVDGRITQQGSTRDMIFDVPFLIEYLSAFMTLEAGDVILTGTPEGLVDTPVGAVIETRIDGVCSLVNTIAAE